MNDLKPTPIIDRNGKATTVWRRMESAMTTGQRLYAATEGFGKQAPMHEPLSREEREVLYLYVQRLKPRQGDFFFDGTGSFQEEFVAETTGLPEFEFGALEESMLRMRRDNLGVEAVARDVTVGDITKTVYFVGTNVENKAAEMEGWLSNGAPSMDPTHFPEHFGGEQENHMVNVQAWWSVQGDVMWTLDEEIARRLIRGIAPY